MRFMLRQGETQGKGESDLIPERFHRQANTEAGEARIAGVSHLLHGLLARFWDFITNMLISFGIDTCAPL